MSRYRASNVFVCVCVCDVTIYIYFVCGLFISGMLLSIFFYMRRWCGVIIVLVYVVKVVLHMGCTRMDFKFLVILIVSYEY
jgi:hypothetical protein